MVTVLFAGNPAKVIKYLVKDKVKMPKHPEYYGYIPKEQFEKAKNKVYRFMIKSIIKKLFRPSQMEVYGI